MKSCAANSDSSVEDNSHSYSFRGAEHSFRKVNGSQSPGHSSTERKIKRICCIGAGYVGGPTCAVIANKVPDIQCTVVDLNAKRVAAWNSPDLPVRESGLRDIVVPARDGIPGVRKANLVFTTELDDAIAKSDLIFISVNTPTKIRGAGAGRALDLSHVEAAARKIAEVSGEGHKIIVEKSTVPCRTAENLRDVLATNSRPGARFTVISNPEFLAEGTAVNDLLDPDRVLIGSLHDDSGLEAANALADLYAHWIPRERITTMNLFSSELAKIAANALLAQRISSINALSAICEAVGAEIDEVSHAVGLDKRVGHHMLKCSLGFGGSCFKKDVLNLAYMAECLHLPLVAEYWRSVVDINEWQKDRFTKLVVSSLYNTVAEKTVAIFGFAYKKNTGDTRESAAISVANTLLAERARINIYDPQVEERQVREELMLANDLDVDDHVKVCVDAYEAARGAHAIVIATDWPEFHAFPSANVNGWASHANDTSEVHSYSLLDGSYESEFLERGTGQSQTDTSKQKENGNARYPSPSQVAKSSRCLDWRRISTIMHRPMFVFDGRNVVDSGMLEDLGFRVRCIGSGNSGKDR